jgi:hypothetical protein
MEALILAGQWMGKADQNILKHPDGFSEAEVIKHKVRIVSCSHQFFRAVFLPVECVGGFIQCSI